MTTGRASGKVILLGEHAAVYGVPALAVGIERGVVAHAEPANETHLTVPVWGVSTPVTDEPTAGEEPLAKAARAVLRASGGGAFRIEAHVELPPGGGLGCSAAMGVAIARALDPNASEPQLLSRADAWERVFHGNPSGVDAAVAASGGCVLFEKGVGVTKVRLARPLVLAVGSTGIASSTKSMVDGVARLRERKREVVDKAFEGIRTLVSNARLALEAGDLRAVGQLMDLAQMLLAGLFVSSPEIEAMCAAARAAGALGAKLTGAGGGGSVVALVDGEDGAARVLEAWKAAGFDGFVAHVAAREGQGSAAPDAARAGGIA